MRYSLYFLFLLWIATGCRQMPSSTSFSPSMSNLPFPGYEMLSAKDKERADSLLAKALDHEALYSLMSDLKPVSSIGFALSYPLGKDSSDTDGQRKIVDISIDSVKMVIDELESWNRVLDALSFDHYQFLLVPFKQVWNGNRNLQVLLCRTDLIDSLLVAQAPFFAQWGFVPDTDPAVLLTAIEFEEKHDRYRAYGYLFGYPQHAVNFFVDASLEQQASGEFVKRNFFHIPVYAKESGHFTYALSEGLQPLPQDSVKYYQAVDILEEYRQIRTRFVNSKGHLQAVELYRNWWRRKRNQRLQNQ